MGKKKRTPVKRSIIPPVILENLEKNAKSVEAQLAARRTIRMTEEARAKRAAGEIIETNKGEDRLITDAGNTENLPGKVVRKEDDPETDDIAVTNLYEDTGDIYAFLRQVAALNSYDGRGAKMRVAAHVGLGMDNSYWNGTLHASGDGHFFRPFHKSPSISRHEWTHAVDGSHTNLVYDGPPGALAEGFLADLWACIMGLWKAQAYATETSFRVAPELFGPGTGINGWALRDAISLEKCYNDPVIGEDMLRHHIREYYTGREDYHGVHINSGIPFRAGALAILEHGGYAWESIFPTLREVVINKRIGSRATFDDAAIAQRKAAVDLFGVGDPVVKAVVKGWRDVGITAIDQESPPPKPDPQPEPIPEPPVDEGSECTDNEQIQLVTALERILPVAQRFIARRSARKATAEKETAHVQTADHPR
jgi:Zn-dependent metalloprotease